MNKKAWLWAVSIVILAGCQPAASQRSDNPIKAQCNAAVCQIKVDVAGTPPRVTVDIDELTVTRGNRGPGGAGVTIHWKLTNNDYEFRDDSIQFYDPRFPTQFDQPGTGDNRSLFRFRNKNSERGSWGYQIKVYDRRTGVWIQLDPFIMNDG
ncbi:MAG: hypothetical protein U1F15_16035 [Burkholderiales bacterium]